MGWFRKKREPLYVPPVEDFIDAIRDEEALSASENEAISYWYAASGGHITRKELGEWMQFAAQFSKLSPARQIIEKGVKEYRDQYPFD